MSRRSKTRMMTPLASDVIYLINVLLKRHALGFDTISGAYEVEPEDIEHICELDCVDGERILNTISAIGGVQAIVSRVDDLKKRDPRAWSLFRDATHTRRGRPFSLHPFPTAAEVASKYGVCGETIRRTKRLIISNIAVAIARDVLADKAA